MNLTERINHGFDLIGAEWIIWNVLVFSILFLTRMAEGWLFLRRRKVNVEQVGDRYDYSARIDTTGLPLAPSFGIQGVY